MKQLQLLKRPPGYQPADSERRCGNCGSLALYCWCRMYARPVDAGYVCDNWNPRR